MLEAYASAQAQYDSAVNALAALRQPKATDVAAAQAQLAQVEATLQSAEQTAAPATPAQVAQAKAQLASAQAGLVAAQGPTPAQLASAQANLVSAQAELLTAQAAVTQAQEHGYERSRGPRAGAGSSRGMPCAAPSLAPTTTPCDLGALQRAVAQAQSRVSSD